ncbi:MAG: ABC transporter permease [Clostridia bacterium]|nr:ABC transporter permease [Clostridia bacterium]
MNILKKYVSNNIKLNKKRTIGSIISIALSTMLICSILIIAISFYTTIKDDTIAVRGNQHATFNFLDKEKAETLISSDEVESYFVTQQVGYIRLKETEGKRYLCLQEFDEVALGNFGIRLLEGKLPENSDEIVISRQIEDNAGIKYNVGDTVVFDIYKLIGDGNYELNQSSTYLRQYEDTGKITKQFIEKKTFKVVGIIEKPDDRIEPLKSAGYTIITKLDNIRERANYSVRYKDVYNAYDISSSFEKELERNAINNSQLLQLEGVKSEISIVKVAVIIVIIIIVILCVSSIIIIRSSFYISISEKVKQYSILSSIGAKTKQIKALAYKENFIISTIGIVLGITLSLGITYILIILVRNMISENSFLTAVEVVYDVPIWTLIASVVISYITMYFASLSSVARLNNISPLSTMNRVDYEKIEEIKEHKVIKKLFGIGGDVSYKNIKRNSKRYNSVMITLVISLVMVFSIVSLVKYTEKMNNDINADKQYNVLVGYKVPMDLELKYNSFLEIVKDERINKFSILRHKDLFAYLDKYVPEEYFELYKSYIGVWVSDYRSPIALTTVGKEEYLRFIEKLGINYNDCKDKIIWCNNPALTGYYTKDGNKKVQLLDLDVGDKIEILRQDKDEKFTLEIAAITDIYPMGLGGYSILGHFLVSDEFLDNKFENYVLSYLTIDTDSPVELCNDINKKYDELLARDERAEQERESNKTLILFAIAYGIAFVIVIISITNIYNMVVSSIMLRKKEFSMLKSIGMTKKEFDNMINLESLFFCIEAIIVSIILGVGINFGIRHFIAKFYELPIMIPYITMIISSLFVFIFVNIIEKITMKKMSNESIIDDIRDENT